MGKEAAAIQKNLIIIPYLYESPLLPSPILHKFIVIRILPQKRLNYFTETLFVEE